jgi:mannose-6-phosphate isomerase
VTTSPGGAEALRAPLHFAPVYKQLVWGGRRMQAWRSDLPEGPIGESWDLSDHPDGMSLVSDGPLAGSTLSELTRRLGPALVGGGFSGQTFPLMVKLIDAQQRLSVQVHPDDALARQMGVGDNGKTECWRVLADGGVIYQGTRPGVDRPAFEGALAAGAVEQTLNRYQVRGGDFFFLEARTVHALGEGCLVYEIQQTSNVTFRVHDWGRMGLDGKPRQLHVAQSLDTIDFTRTGFGPRPLDRPLDQAPDPRGGTTRHLAECPYFDLEERTGSALALPARDRAQIVVCLEGQLTVTTDGGALPLRPMQTALVPAVAGAALVEGTAPIEGADACRILVASPRW